MADSLNRRRWSGWCLVPGPVDFVEPEFSFDMQDPIAEYRASLVAEVALSIPGVRLNHSALPSWWDWRARRTGDGGSYIDLAMTLLMMMSMTADRAPSEMCREVAPLV